MKRIILAALGLLAVPASVNATAGPTVNPHSYVVRATTTATSLQALLGSGAQTDASGFLCNPTTTVLCVGGAEVDTTTTGSATPGAGGHCFPVCTSATCAAACVSIQAPLGMTFVRVAAGTLDAFLLYGGWR
jgi:hypothetical protein